MFRLAFLVDSPSKRAHANVVSRLALGLVETGQVETTIVCYSADAAAVVASGRGPDTPSRRREGVAFVAEPRRLPAGGAA